MKIVFVACVIVLFSLSCFAADMTTGPDLPKINWGYFSGGTVCLVSSSHQDIAWLDTPAQCEINRDVQTISPALELMRAEPNYCFGMEQSLNLKEYLQRHPERRNEILQRAKEKRFVWGATYVQPYESLESGEELIRQAYFGRKWIESILQGVNERVAYNVDVPGRAMQMPQILKKAGIDYLVVSRQKEGVFNWASPDGSMVAVFSPGNYYSPLSSYGDFKCDMNQIISKVSKKLAARQDYYRSRNLPPVFCIYLCADGLRPVDYSNVCRKWNLLVEEFNKSSPADNKMPLMKHTTAAYFMDSVVRPDAKLDIIAGERPNLWLYIHGPTHHWAISAKRDAGVLLPASEVFSTIEGILEGSFADYPAQKLAAAWESAIYPDHGWGGKHGDVTDQLFKEKYEYARDESKNILNKSLKAITARVKTPGKGTPVIVFNDLSWPRDGIVKTTINNMPESFIVRDSAGKISPHQILSLDSSAKTAEICFEAKNIPPIGYKTYYIIEESASSKKIPSLIEQAISSYENDYYKVTLAQGGLKSIFDKQLNRELLRTDKFLAGEIFSMQSVGNGAGEFLKIQMPTMEGFDKGSNHKSEWTFVEHGDVRDVLQTQYSFVDCNVVERVIFYKHFRKIDFEIDIKNWAGRHNRELRAAFAFAMQKGNIAYEVPMGILKVGQDEMTGAPGGWTAEGTYTQNASEIHPREVQNFITAYNNNFGLTISGSVAVWDYIDPTAEPVDYPVLQPLILATRKSCHAEGNWYEQKGDHSYRFSLTSHKPDWKQAYKPGIESSVICDSRYYKKLKRLFACRKELLWVVGPERSYQHD
jgi:alpha-mannosidase